MSVTIARPDAPNHYMVLRPINRRVVVRLPDRTLIADTNKATRLLEHGRTLYDPVVYLPADAIQIPLNKQEKSTHCPLKGDASYFSYSGEDDLAWSYEKPLGFSEEIAGLFAFYGNKVIIEEHPE